MPTVAFDYQTFALQAYGGISRYYCELAAHVSGAAGFSSRVVAPLHFNEYLKEYQGPKTAHYLRRRIAKSSRLYRAIDVCISPWLLAALQPDILHQTYYKCGPVPHGARVVVTVFDMIHELYPSHFPGHDHTAAMKRRAVERADAVICISEGTANDLRHLLGVPANKISVTHLGFSDVFARTATTRAQSPGNVRAFLLYVGHRQGYKNFARVLEAYGSSARLMQDVDLVAFGSEPFSAKEQTSIDGLRPRPGAVRHQAGSDAELAQAYSGALALVYPSEYEGFGIPPLEAMSAGCPVVCSDASSIPEVVGDAGEYFSPLDVASIRNAVERVVYDDRLRAELVKRGLRRCAQFSWDKCANETMQIYQRLCS